jgi:hypothetical protein
VYAGCGAEPFNVGAYVVDRYHVGTPYTTGRYWGLRGVPVTDAGGELVLYSHAIVAEMRT